MSTQTQHATGLPQITVCTTAEIVRDYESLPADITTVRWITVDDMIAVLDEVKSWYPTDIFPEESDSHEGTAAKMARHLCGVFKRALLPEGPTRGESEQT